MSGEPSSKSARNAVILVIGGWALLVLGANLGYWTRLGSLVKPPQPSASAVFMVDQPGFAELFWQTVRHSAHPAMTPHYLGALHTSIFAAVLVVVGIYWYRRVKRRDDSAVFLLPAAAPLLVGLTLVLAYMPRFVENYTSLAGQGLVNPGAMGAVAGEMVLFVWFGALLSLLCLGAMLLSRGRARRLAAS